MKFLIYTIGAILLITYMSAAKVDFTEQIGWGGDCVAGKRQSPIDFPKNFLYTVSDHFKVVSTNYGIINDLAFAKEPVDLKRYHLINVSKENGYLMARKNDVMYKYTLLDVHFHILAEHTFGGKAYAAEMHMVHKKDREWLKKQGKVDFETTTDKNLLEENKNEYLVVGTVFAINGTTDNAEIAKMNLNTGNNVNNLDLKKFSTPNMVYYHYLGGLTTPNCDQVVNWVVNSNIVNISQKQGANIKSWINGEYPNGNTRVVQALNNRKIYKIDGSEVLAPYPLPKSSGFLKGNMMMLISVVIAAFFL